MYIVQQGAQIPVTMLLWQLNFVLMGPQHETCLMSWFWYLELLGGSQIYGKFWHLLRRDMKFSIKRRWREELNIWSNIFLQVKYWFVKVTVFCTQIFTVFLQILMVDALLVVANTDIMLYFIQLLIWNW